MNILIVEDEKSLAELVKINLELEGFKTKICHTATKTIDVLNDYVPDLILLDIILPDGSGFEIQSKIKKKEIPVIFLTAKTHLKDRLLGLELGADDYITKPFDNRELMLRIKAVLRRSKETNHDQNIINCDPFMLALDQQSFFIEDDEIYLTKTELKIMKKLMNNHKKVLSREQLLKSIWGNNIIEASTRTIDIHIRRIRKKLGKYGDMIKTLYGIGYKLEVDNND